MNKCCRDARSYLEESELVNVDELQEFIDKFNIEIENYSANGLSSYLLSCVELCIKLSGSIGYTKGGVVTKWLKGHALFLGGHYSLARNCFFNALQLLDEKDLEFGAICSSYSLNLAYIGEFNEALKLVERLVNSDAKGWVNYTLSSILKFRNETKLSYSILDRSTKENSLELYSKIDRLLDLNNLTEAKSLLESLNNSIVMDNPFFIGYNTSIKLLINVREGLNANTEEVLLTLDQLGSKKSFYHYIDGLLNLADIYLLSGDYKSCFDLLDKIEGEKRELIILDCRLYRLYEKCSIAEGDFKRAHTYITRLSEISRKCSTFDIDKSLRDMSLYLYNNNYVV